MIEMITGNQNGSKIISEKNIETCNKKHLWVVKQLCQKNLFTLEGYYECIRKIFHFHYGIPIFISNNLILFPIKSIRAFENIWINYRAIKIAEFSIKNYIYFFSGKKAELPLSKDSYIKMTEKINEIEDYYYKLKSENFP